MEEVFDQLQALGRTEKRVAMATLVATRGTSPKKEGAKMWVSEAGRILGSVTIGGCVDARVIEESERVLASSTPRLLTMPLGEEDAWEGGFTCAGTVQVLIEPVDLVDAENRLTNIYREIQKAVSEGKSAALVTQLDEASAKLAVFDDGRVVGSLGNEELDAQAREKALELIERRISRTIPLETRRSVREAFFEVHGPTPSLVVFGAVHVAMHLVRLATELGLRTTVIDARPRFATRERFPAADELLIGIPSEIAESIRYTSSTLVVLAAHDYKYDIPVLKTVLKTNAAYIGLLGSTKRGKAILDFLREAGCDPSSLARVRVPAGLDIGAETASEIALSILAEAMAVKAGRNGHPMSERR
jgi:xanthine dehydrogenase accessory factor